MKQSKKSLQDILYQQVLCYRLLGFQFMSSSLVLSGLFLVMSLNNQVIPAKPQVIAIATFRRHQPSFNYPTQQLCYLAILNNILRNGYCLISFVQELTDGITVGVNGVELLKLFLRETKYFTDSTLIYQTSKLNNTELTAIQDKL